MTILPRKISVTKGQRRALRLMAEAHRVSGGPASFVTNSHSFYVDGVARINERTMWKFLILGLICTASRGLRGIALTERGWEYAR